jgi:hypothetical protein
MDTTQGVPVQHEKPGYVYRPEGLMAEGWGKAGRRTEVAAFIRAGNLRDRHWMDNDKGRDALEYIWSLDDATVLAARIENSPEHLEVCRRLGGSIYGTPPPAGGEGVNPLWVTDLAARTAYERGLIDERELDRITDEG